MWQANVPADSEPLQQGDLLRGVVFPSLTSPLVDPQGLGRVTLEVETRDALVVSQCCTVRRGTLALAPTRLVPFNDPGHEKILRNQGPGRGPDSTAAPRFVFELFALDAHPAMPADPAGHVRVADLTRIVPFTDCEPAFRVKRVGAMTVLARRALRYNLSTFWGRTTAEDAALLGDGGHALTIGL